MQGTEDWQTQRGAQSISHGSARQIEAIGGARQDAHLLGLACPLLNPLLRLLPSLVERKKARLAATLDELIRLRNELGGEDPARELGVGRDRVRRRIP